MQPVYIELKKTETTVHKIYIHLTVRHGFRSFVQSGSVCTGTGKVVPTLTDHLWSHMTDTNNGTVHLNAALQWIKTIVNAGRCSLRPPGFSSLHWFFLSNVQRKKKKKKSLCFMRPVVWLKTFRDINPFKWDGKMQTKTGSACWIYIKLPVWVLHYYNEEV